MATKFTETVRFSPTSTWEVNSFKDFKEGVEFARQCRAEHKDFISVRHTDKYVVSVKVVPPNPPRSAAAAPHPRAA